MDVSDSLDISKRIIIRQNDICTILKTGVNRKINHHSFIFESTELSFYKRRKRIENNHCLCLVCLLPA